MVVSLIPVASFIAFWLMPFSLAISPSRTPRDLAAARWSLTLFILNLLKNIAQMFKLGAG